MEWFYRNGKCVYVLIIVLKHTKHTHLFIAHVILSNYFRIKCLKNKQCCSLKVQPRQGSNLELHSVIFRVSLETVVPIYKTWFS